MLIFKEIVILNEKVAVLWSFDGNFCQFVRNIIVASRKRQEMWQLEKQRLVTMAIKHQSSPAGSCVSLFPQETSIKVILTHLRSLGCVCVFRQLIGQFMASWLWCGCRQLIGRFTASWLRCVCRQLIGWFTASWVWFVCRQLIGQFAASWLRCVTCFCSKLKVHPTQQTSAQVSFCERRRHQKNLVPTRGGPRTQDLQKNQILMDCTWGPDGS